MGRSGEQSFIPVLVELLPFSASMSITQEREIESALARITGEDSFVFWSDWFRWLSARPEIRPPPGFDVWLSQLLAVIDPALGEFFYPGVESRIRLEEILWGNVPKDGIPALNDPPVNSPDEAAYLIPNDRVFGASVNGHHRAYPLRIMNAHEMVNDVLGGEPILLAY